MTVHIFLLLCMPGNFRWILDDVQFIMLHGMCVIFLWRVFDVVWALATLPGVSLTLSSLALKLYRVDTEHSICKANCYGAVPFWGLYLMPCVSCEGFPVWLMEMQSLFSLVLSLWMDSLTTSGSSLLSLGWFPLRIYRLLAKNSGELLCRSL